MKLIFERSVPGRRCSILPACDVEETPLPESLRRAEAPILPELSEQDLSRHYTELNHHVHGVNCGFYPLGSCIRFLVLCFPFFETALDFFVHKSGQNLLQKSCKIGRASCRERV